MKLYGSNLSPFVERCIITLDVKGALDQVEHLQPEGGMHSAAHFAQNPMGKIPYLILDDGTLLIESQAIAEYFDAIFGGPTLLPDDPLERAKVQMLCRLYDTHIIRGFAPPLMALIWQRKDDAAIANAIEKDIPKAFDDLEYFIGDQGRAVGDAWTLADAALTPMLFQLEAFIKPFGIGDFGDRPKLNRWKDAVLAADIGKNAMQRMGAVLEKMMAARARAAEAAQ